MTDFYDVDQVRERLGNVSTGFAYRVIRDLNREMSSKGGYLILRGKVNKKFFDEHIYGQFSEDRSATK